VATLLVPATGALAQNVSPGNDNFTISLYAGGLSPSGDLGAGEFDSSGTIGGALGWWITRNVGIRGNVAFAQTDVPAAAPSALLGQNPDVWFYSADLLVRFPFQVGTGWLSPYVLGGLGAKTYSFENLDTETDFAGNFGGGAEYRFDPTSRWGVFTEVKSYVSEFERFGVSDTQWDVAWTGGISLNF
jgi:outer membrane protein W